MTPPATNSQRWIAVGALWTAVGVALGAFGAHVLEERLAASGRTATWDTGVQYHVWHGLALVLVGLWRGRAGAVGGAGAGRAVAPLFAVGSLLFSGSIYGLCLDGPGAVLGPITPLGGTLLILGWILFARAALRAERGSQPG